jgi:hypothetical protein
MALMDDDDNNTVSKHCEQVSFYDAKSSGHDSL